jgi:bifunctional UDP-N-acetylglucosamine pyrophosphorylase / glucosamine-1-phosphate N-acetyltransferase
VNTRVHLAEAARVMQQRINERHMLAGVTMTDPDARVDRAPTSNSAATS